MVDCVYWRLICGHDDIAEDHAYKDPDDCNSELRPRRHYDPLCSALLVRWYAGTDYGAHRCARHGDTAATSYSRANGNHAARAQLPARVGPSSLVATPRSRLQIGQNRTKRVNIFAPRPLRNGWTFGPRTCASPSGCISISRPRGSDHVVEPFLQR
jgi:hypothetical protein